jgi:phosphatidylglycerol---prolipoprotein diacylglyceryl transferase
VIETFRSLFAPPRHFILIVAALWIGLWLAEKRSERHGVSKEQLNSLTFYSLLAYIIGGRLLFALANLSAFTQSPLSLFSPNPDLFDPFGGLAAAVVTGLIYGQRGGLRLWSALDALTPLFAALAIGLWLAHLAAGTAFGSPTSVSWGMELWNEVRHPLQVYGLIGSSLILLWLLPPKRALPPGLLFLHFSALTAGVQVFLEAFRGEGTLVFGGLRLAQIAAWTVLAAALFLSEMVRRRAQENQPPGGIPS